MKTLLPALLLSLPALGCVTSYESKPITGVAIPVKDTTPKPPADAREAPPGSGTPHESHFPKVVWADLPSGLKIATIESHALPVVEIRVVAGPGRAFDGEKPGLVKLLAEMMKESAPRFEAIGATVGVATHLDSIELGVQATSDHLAAALELAAKTANGPPLSQGELDKAKKRLGREAIESARSSGSWAAGMILSRDLFALPSEHHPYATYDASDSELTRLTASDCRAAHDKMFVAKNTFVVVAGDVAPADVKAAAEKAFAGYRGGEPPVLSFTDPTAPEGLKITVVDRPNAAESEVYVGMLGPDRRAKEWDAWEITGAILGGGPTSRLASDLVSKKSMASATSSWFVEVAHGPTLLVSAASTSPASTGKAVRALLDDLEDIANKAPDADEVASARRFLAQSFVTKMEGAGALADELVKLHVLGLPDDYDDTIQKEMNAVTPALVNHVAGEHVRPGHAAVVVVGDASRIDKMLSHFGEVKVLDPTKDFARERSVPMDARAPLEGDGK